MPFGCTGPAIVSILSTYSGRSVDKVGTVYTKRNSSRRNRNSQIILAVGTETTQETPSETPKDSAYHTMGYAQRNPPYLPFIYRSTCISYVLCRLCCQIQHSTHIWSFRSLLTCLETWHSRENKERHTVL